MTSNVIGGQAIFECKVHVFKLPSNIKVKLVDKMKQRIYLCVNLYVKHKKIANSRSFYLISNSWQNPRRRPKWRPCLVTSQASNSATTHKKSFKNTATYQKLERGIPSSPPPLPLNYGFYRLCS